MWKLEVEKYNRNWNEDDIVFAHNGTNGINLGSGNDTVSYELNDSAIYASLGKW